MFTLSNQYNELLDLYKIMADDGYKRSDGAIVKKAYSDAEPKKFAEQLKVIIKYLNAKTALDDHYGAISDYIKAIEINPKYEKAYINRGRSFYSINDKENACKDFKKAVFLGSTTTEEWLNSEGGSWCRNM